MSRKLLLHVATPDYGQGKLIFSKDTLQELIDSNGTIPFHKIEVIINQVVLDGRKYTIKQIRDMLVSASIYLKE